MNDELELSQDLNPEKDQEHPTDAAQATEESAGSEPAEQTAAKKPKREKKPKFSGAYWYVETDEDELKKQAFIRMLLSVIAFLLQVVVLLLPQGGLEYVTNTIPSYAYVYMWAVFVTLGVAIYVNIMNFTRYKLLKRIPVERAPKKGFKRRSFFGAEVFVVVNALLFIIELSFMCIHFDGVGLTAMFLTLLATAAAVWARQVTVLALRNAELIPAPALAEPKTENNDKE